MIFFLLSAAPCPSAFSQNGTVFVSTRFEGAWPVQQWAPLRLTFRDPGPLKSVEVFCAEAGPRFQLPDLPAPSGVSHVDLAVYAQIASGDWVVRLTDEGGTSRDVRADLAGRFITSASPIPAEATRNGDRSATAIGRMTLAADQTFSRQWPETFGQPQATPLENPEFYWRVWTSPPSPDSAVRWPSQWRWTVLLTLAGGLLAVTAAGLVLRPRPMTAAAAATAILLLTGGWVVRDLRAKPARVLAEFEVVTRPGAPQAKDAFTVPVRRQKFAMLGALRDGQFNVPPAHPTGGAIVARGSEKLDVTMPAAFETDPPRPIRANLPGGGYRAFVSTRYSSAGGTISYIPSPGDNNERMLVIDNWPVTMQDAWIVTDAEAVHLGPIDPGSISIPIQPGWAQPWSASYEPDPADAPDRRMRKTLLKYWSTQYDRGGRYWLVGFEPANRSNQPDEVHLPALWLVNLGPIEGLNGTSPAAE